MARSSTSFKPGHQMSVGNAGGPRYHDYEKEADDLLKWAESDTVTSLYEFTEKKTYCGSDLVGFANQSPKFKQALMKAKEKCAINRERRMHKGSFSETVWKVSRRLYDPILDQHERDLANEELDRKMQLIKYELEKRREYEAKGQAPPHSDILDAFFNSIKARDAHNEGK